MGTVHEAVDEVLGRSVALKLIAPALAGDAGFRRRFTREAQALAALDSPHVVQVFAHGELGGRLYIATQLVPDGDLGDLVRRHGPPPPEVGVGLVAQVAAGLAEAHRVGLVHRDIKPGNVLVRNRGDCLAAYLADFGIAVRVDGNAPAHTRLTVGTPMYMAPELHDGGPPSPAADIYAVGCLLWVTLTGRTPYSGSCEAAVVHAHASAPIPQLPARRRFERRANRVLRSALAKDPTQRYAAAELLRDDLRSLVDVARRDGARRPRPTRSSRRLARLLAPATLVVVLGAVASVTHHGEQVAGDGGPARERAIARIAAGLRAEGHLAPAAALCAARRLVDARGVDALRDAEATEVLTSGAACLWPGRG